MTELWTPERYRAAAAARERSARTMDRGLKAAYKQLAIDYDQMASSVEKLRATRAAISERK
jgi:hypothetical protein